MKFKISSSEKEISEFFKEYNHLKELINEMDRCLLHLKPFVYIDKIEAEETADNAGTSSAE